MEPEPELHPALAATRRFEVRRPLGSGSFGVVFDAIDRESGGAAVALKWLRNGDASALARFKREFRALADLQHPNLVRYRDLFTIGGEWFFTMDLIDGVDLMTFLRSKQDDDPRAAASSLGSSTVSLANAPPKDQTMDLAKPPPPKVRPLFFADLSRLRHALEQLASGLDTLHAAELVHRDLKPSNVLVTHDESPRIVILDLGLVTELGSDGVAESKSGIVVGTPAYMSPEQALGGRITPASDWYALGVILYQALTGQLPFDESGYQSLLLRKQMEQPRHPSELVREVPDALAELCMDLLSRTPELRPTGKTFRERLERALPSTTIRSHEEPAAFAFVGRSNELAQLQAVFDASTNKNTNVVALVSGLSGMGKTTLVRHFLDDIRRTRSETVILEGRCYEREAVPYKALDAIVDALSRYLGRLPEIELGKLLPRDFDSLGRVFPVLVQFADSRTTTKRRRSRSTPLDGHEERRRAFEALRELLSRIADSRPLIVFIDDLQWGDADSEPLLKTLLREPDAPALLLIAAYRADETSPLVRALLATGTAREIAIHELSKEARLSLAKSLLGPHGDESNIVRLSDESDGSPLFLRQLAVETQNTRFDLAKAIEKRFRALPDDAARFLAVLAIAGRPLPIVLAGRVAGIEDPRGIVADLRNRTLVRTRGVEASGEVEMYHDRIRTIVAGALAENEAKKLHLKLARVLSSAGDADDAEAIALHFKLADDVALAAQYAERAADRATGALAFDRAAAMYEMAIELASSTGRGDADSDSGSGSEKGARGGRPNSLILKLAEALTSAGRNREAAERFLEAAKKASPVDALDLKRRAAEQMLFSGQLSAGLQIIDRLLDSLHMRGPVSPLAIVFSLLWQRFLLFLRGLRFEERSVDELPRDLLVRIDTCFTLSAGLGMVDPIRGADYQTRYLLMALAAGEPTRIAKGFAIEAAYRASDGVRQRARVEQLLSRSLSLGERVGQPRIIGLARTIQGAASVLFGEYEKTVELCDEATTILREKCIGATFEVDNAALLSGLALTASGKIAELGRRLPAQLEEARARGNRYSETMLRVQCHWMLELAKDDVAAAKADLELSDEWVVNRALLQRVWQAMNGTNIALYEDDAERAHTLANEAWTHAKEGYFVRAEGIRVLLTDLRARAAIACAIHASLSKDENKDEAKRRAFIVEARTHLAALRREAWPTARGGRLILEAALCDLEGERDRAIAHLRDALVEVREKGLGLHEMAARYRLGELLDDAEGAMLIAKAEAELTAQTIAKPAKMVRVYAPFASLRVLVD